MSIEVSFPLWIFRQTQEVAAASAFVIEPSCCVSYEQNNICGVKVLTRNYSQVFSERYLA